MNTTSTIVQGAEQTCERVKVVIRCRPMNNKEIDENHPSVLALSR
jgi:hypothetical protein